MSEGVSVFVDVDEDYATILGASGTAAIEAAVFSAMRAAGELGPAALSVVVGSTDGIRALNREYAGKDEETDVLSFPAEDIPYAVEPGEPPYLGDIYIAFPVAQAQAASRGLSVTAELQTLAVHGTLHLLGYDHGQPDEEAAMMALQTSALEALWGASA